MAPRNTTITSFVTSSTHIPYVSSFEGYQSLNQTTLTFDKAIRWLTVPFSKNFAIKSSLLYATSYGSMHNFAHVITTNGNHAILAVC
mmetsp:Transcript_193/g.246  ORF Transcript_193/g.246 Transcript_193/m.246 type:complete len:87 (+) Transcript_193:828-1088(+)